MARSSVATLTLQDVVDILDKVQSLKFMDRAVWEAIGEQLTIIHKKRYEQEIDPDGNAWTPLNEKYQAKKKEKANYQKILQYSGRLFDTLHAQASDYGVKFGSNSVYAATQHYGRDGIPARQIIGINEADKKIIAEEVIEAYVNWLSAQ
ncbi:phage virion morphogenesis protein [Psychrobacter sp. I-STPA10]|uniref:phage virion morphogenesis protein n=1 Tax=Psychrobacter sp. I-STPA10 TaxID=2585769 RepID=UPI001E586AC7|nr:phage virion morphogenesis protein [Psychrobacter sp. I-STPA10]